ncbi:MAG: hypothetical protein RLZZ175_2397 [Bacteroidota bacterium]|jgi:type I restriction enzyme R subunit
MISKFTFLKDDYLELFSIAELAEQLIHLDPNSSLAKSRLFSEKIVSLIFEFDELEIVDGNQVDKINFLFQENAIPDIVRDILHTIRKSGNRATHDGKSSYQEAFFILKKCYNLGKWFFETYEDELVDQSDYVLPPAKSDAYIAELKKQNEELSTQLIDNKNKISALNQTPELKSSRRIRGTRNAGNINLDEFETRKLLIDPLLKQAGWECDTENINYKSKKTIPQKGKNLAIAEWPCNGKWADYALFIGTDLYGIVEAKKFASDISTDLHQSKIYAERIEDKEHFNMLGKWENYKVPFLFSTNGRGYLEQLKTKSGIWFLDIRKNTNRATALRGWFSPEGLVQLYQRDIDTANTKLQESDYDYLQSKNGLGLRYYQIDAIKAVENKVFTQPDDKRSLLVMATGTGKTRTMIGMVYRFIKSNRFNRILFLTDRRLLATQALDSFKDNKIENLNTFADVYKMQELKIAFPEGETRLHFATVQSMVKRLFYSDENPLPIDTYDCIIIDEAHRGYNLDKEIDDEDLHFKDENDYVGQYKRVIEYFNAYIIGLTATPALHTTEIFGKPVHNYSYREAVIDGFLTDHEPPFLIKTKLSEEGILWEKGEKPKVYNPETNTLEELAALEDDVHIEIEQFNRGVITESFNRTVIQELVRNLDPESDEKTLIFTVRDSHADMVVDILKEEFANIGYDVPDKAIVKITGKVHDVESLVKQFKNEKFPNIAVTVDLLSTGIDVPQICNLVFMRRVRSRILFEQMIGRATRICPDIDKQYFKIFDAVRVYEALQDYTQMKTVSNPVSTFKQLIDEFEYINSADRDSKQVQQIIAKLQRKKNKIQEESLEQFTYVSKGKNPSEFIEMLKTIEPTAIRATLNEYKTLWTFLDDVVFKPRVQLVSDHQDQIIGIDRGYGKAQKPEDYIEGFKQFIENNRNEIMALNIVCTSPKELDRRSLKELKLLLDNEGYNEAVLNTAWKNAKNQDLAADIISYIRTLALDTVLVSHEDRIKNAIKKIKATSTSWTKIQLKWLDRFEAQLLKESVLVKADLDAEPFKSDGGFVKINRIFDDKLEIIIDTLNEYLYSA